jgi:hypothetical protein
VIPLGWVDGDIDLLIGINPRLGFWGPFTYANSQLVAFRDGALQPIAASEVWELARCGRFIWYGHELQPSTPSGQRRFESFVRLNPEGHEALIDEFDTRDRREAWLIAPAGIISFLICMWILLAERR